MKLTTFGKLIVAAAILGLCIQVRAQELSPRAFWPAPEGTRIATVGYSYTSGDTLTDPSLPITGINSDINNAFATLFQTFNLAGRSANIIVEVPYLWGKTKGVVGDGFAIDRNLDGMGDIALTVAMNVMGAPTMTPEDFAVLRADPHPLLGVSLRVVTPTGSYNKKNVINTGANRWAAKAAIGYIYPLHPNWLLELTMGAWMFDDNNDFARGKKEQKPIYAVETHLIRRFNPGFWGSLDVNYYTGGRTTVDGEKLDDLQRTSKYGVTLVFPFAKGKAIKVVYSGGSVSGNNNNFDTVLVSFNIKLR